MSHNNPTIDSGIVEAPIPSDARYPAHNPAPSQASQDEDYAQTPLRQGDVNQSPSYGEYRDRGGAGATHQKVANDPAHIHDQNSTIQNPSSTEAKPPPLPLRDQHIGQDPYNVTPAATQGHSQAGGSTADHTTEGMQDNRSTASKTKGLAETVHGAGETIRGTFNREIDRAFGDKAGLAKNDQIAQSGRAEILEGNAFNKPKAKDDREKDEDRERSQSGALGGSSPY